MDGKAWRHCSLKSTQQSAFSSQGSQNWLNAECLLRRRRVVPGAVAHLVPLAVAVLPVHLHLEASKWGGSGLAVGVVSEQVLSAQLDADLPESVFQPLTALGIVVLPACIQGNLNQGVFAAGVASGFGGNRHDDDAINDRLGLLRATQRPFVSRAARRVAAVGNQHQNFSPLAVDQRFRAEEDGVIKRRSRSDPQAIDALVDTLQVRAEAGDLVDVLRDLEDGKMIHRAHDGVHKPFGGSYLELEIALRAEAGIDG